MLFHRSSTLGFSRIEVLLAVIAVAAVGILAALVIPRAMPSDEASVVLDPESPASKLVLGVAAAFDSMPKITAAEAKASALYSNLATIRQAIKMYAYQHDDSAPTDLVAQLTGPTNRAGEPGTKYGPYLRSGFPKNPYSGDPRVRHADAMPDAPAGDEGWVYCGSTGEIRANLSGEAPDGKRFFDS